MLVLTRKSGEKIHIGDNVCVKVVTMSASRVKLAIEAPEDVHILRGELWETRQGFLDGSSEASNTSANTQEH